MATVHTPSSDSAVAHGLYAVPLRTIAPVTSLALVFFTLWLAFFGQRSASPISLTLAFFALLATLLVHRREQRLALAGLLLCIANAGGAVLAAWVMGRQALPWSILALMANFFIVRLPVALTLNLLLTAGLMLRPGVLLGAPHLQGISVITLTFGFGYRFSRHLQGDRTRLEQLASVDSLTGVPNRRALEQALNQQIHSQRESRLRQALVVLDIDHFKDVNDQHGHRAGDIALSDLAAILRFELRDNDKVFRFGGEEFVILVEASSRDALARFTERIRRAVYQALRGPGGRITISAGAAMYAGEQRWEDWFNRADAALYTAKRKGRNSIALAD